MREEFLHYIWKFQKFTTTKLTTNKNEALEIHKVGKHNTEKSGPDFFNSQLKIDHQTWVGTVEIHLKSSDWYAHNHQNDPAYDNVILHVVWEDDIEIFRSNNIPIPTLELKSLVSLNVLNNYRQLFNTKSKIINCESQISGVSEFTWSNWLERLYFERIEEKARRVKELYLELNQDWEATCFCIIAQYFGGNINGEDFLKIAKSIPFKVFQKSTDSRQLEALLLGQGNLLKNSYEDAYFSTLKKEFQYLKHKYKLEENIGLQLQFFRLRPSNFPTIRLAQLAQLYNTHHRLFSKIKLENNLDTLKNIFHTSTSEYWETHFNIGKESKKSKKKLSNSFIELLIINAILPIRFFYYKTIGKEIGNDFLNLLEALKLESNAITKHFKSININMKNAMHSQAAIQLRKQYCDKNRCLECAIGFELLRREN